MELSPNDAVRAIKAMTNTLERIGYINKLTLIGVYGTWILVGLMLLVSIILFIIGTRTHYVHTEALRILIERSK